MTEGLDEDVVNFIPNYDNQFQQPEVLPAAYPNLLVNGASGIAVGMATNMAPHNLIEVVAAAVHLLENPKATLDEIMEFVPGPDLRPGGGVARTAGTDCTAGTAEVLAELLVGGAGRGVHEVVSWEVGVATSSWL
mgnify:CR=1 FL=1